ncbi:MAG: hypothetical protein HY918_02190 [Candidatus Doudnabacteria bacterium]|nr:hypothetical protein [Candidatus Doudnabacteria bacterium]
MNKLEDKFNNAIELLKNGVSKEQALLDMPKEKDELSSLLDLSASLMNLPKNPVPTPLMQRKYILTPEKKLWFAWIHISKLATVSMSVMLLVSTLAVTGYAAYNSGPGQTLFAVKKSAEQVQLVLTYSQDEKANLQIEITKKRLDEAQKIFQDPTSNIEQEKAALSELANQTSTAIAVVNTVTQTSPKAQSNHPLIASLEDLTKKQQNLISAIKPNSEIQEAASGALTALNQSTAKISEIKESIAVAANEQTLAALAQDPNSVSVSGLINNISKDKITIDKTTFELSDKTIVKDSEGKVLPASQLLTAMNVSVSGIKSETKLVAKEIIINKDEANEPEVKSASTTITSTTTVGKNASTSTATVDEQKPSSTSTDPSKATGSFIFEDPLPQYTR